MTKEEVLRLLRTAGDFVSGQQMSQQLNLSRASVWKAVQALREAGYEIESVTNRGYRLVAPAGKLSRIEIAALLEGHPWQDRLVVLETVDSTNNFAKKLAADGASHGTVVIAEQQTGGRGRRGRSFSSPPGMGVYLTVILRPNVPPTQLLHLTALAAVATAEAAQTVSGVRPGIKWTNDLVSGGRKLTGILTELSLVAESGLVDYAVVGIGTNCGQEPADFPPEVRDIAISLRQMAGREIDRNRFAAALIRQLHRADAELLTHKQAWMQAYSADCITVGKDVKVLRGETARTAFALGIDPDGGLLVRYEDGSEEVVNSGEVTVRGMYGYV